jgi:histone demethylase JARID1
MEGAAREVNGDLKSKKMDNDYDSTDRECFSCFYDLHMSAISCQCSPNRFACLNHANILCSCDMERKIAFFRYSMEELNTLVAALEGDQTAVCLWGQDHLGLVCPSDNVQKRKMDSGKSTEFSGSAINVNVVSGFGGSQDGCPDLQKLAGFLQEYGIQNNCIDLNSRIKEEHGKDRMFTDHGLLQNTD